MDPIPSELRDVTPEKMTTKAGKREDPQGQEDRRMAHGQRRIQHHTSAINFIQYREQISHS